jgi:capsular polysaccharide transport system ATP-binding protein
VIAMIHLDAVTDTPLLYGRRVPLLTDVTFDLPLGRYALVSETPEDHRAVIDVIAGLRPPDQGSVSHTGQISWPIGRQGFVRGRANGQDLIDLVCGLYDIEADYAFEVVATLISRPDYLDKRVEQWPPYVRQEFTFALALLPNFDIYVVDAAIPFEASRFTRLWQSLFEERLAGKSLILATYRQNQMLEYCAKALVYERSGLSIDEDLDACIKYFPARPSREDLGGANLIGAYNESGDLPY